MKPNVIRIRFAVACLTAFCAISPGLGALELGVGVGRTNLEYRDFDRWVTSFQATGNVEINRWLGVELAFLHVNQTEGSTLPPERRRFTDGNHILHFKADAVRLGPTLTWRPVERVKFYGKALDSYQIVRHRLLGDFTTVLASWQTSKNVHLAAAAGVKMRVAGRVWTGLEFEAEKLWRVDSRTWRGLVSFAW